MESSAKGEMKVGEKEKGLGKKGEKTEKKVLAEKGSLSDH